MTTTRTDDDLERLLRSTFDSQAATVSHGPGWTGAGHPARPRRWIAPLVAAALVLALVGAFLVAHTRTHRATPPASGPRDFSSFEVVGYPVTSRLTYPDYRSVVVRTPDGPRYGDVGVDVSAPGKYETLPLQHKRPVMISGHRGVTGVSGYELVRHKTRPIRDVIWQFAPKQWAVVQQMGGLRRAPTEAELLAVARATRPQTQLAQTTPYRLTAVPAGFAFDHTELQPTTGILILVLETPRHRTLTLTAVPAAKAGSGPRGEFTLRHAGTLLDIYASRSRGVTRADRVAARFAAHHIVWDTTDLRFIVP